MHRFALFLILLFSGLLRAQPIYTDRELFMADPGRPAELLLKARLLSLQKSGYLLAEARPGGPDSWMIHFGPQYKVAVVSDFPDLDHKDSAISMRALGDEIDAWLKMRENTGFPFAQMRFEIRSNDSGIVHLKAIPLTGDKYYFDSILFDNFNLSPGLLWRAGKIRPGEEFNYSKLQGLVQKLVFIDGLSSMGTEPLLLIRDNKLMTRISMRQTKKDKLTGIIGVASQTEDPRFVFTGEAEGRFYNIAGSGVSVEGLWRAFRAMSQEFKLNGSLPYVLGVPFISKFKLGFDKFDTSYTIFRRGLQLRFPLGQRMGFDIGIEAITRNRIFVDENSVKFFRKLPENPGSENVVYSAGFEYNSVFPVGLSRKGWLLRSNLGVGTRTFIRDSRLAAIYWTNSMGQTENIYDSLDRVGKIRSTQFTGQLDLEKYTQLSPIFVLKLGANARILRMPQLYFNELFRLGGINDMKGFNEQSIFASEYYMGMAELRLMSGNSGFFGAFVNAAHVINTPGLRGPKQDNPIGFGLSAALRTRAGILNIVWALGKKNDQPLSLNNSKFHFSISSDF